MKKLTKLFSAVAFVSALALVGCANPNGPATDNNAKPDKENGSGSETENNKPAAVDNLKGNTFKGTKSKYVFAEDGTCDVYGLNKMMGPNGKEEIKEEQIGQVTYTLTDDLLTATFVKVIFENDKKSELLTKTEWLNKNLEIAKNDLNSPWQGILQMANNDEKKAEEIYKSKVLEIYWDQCYRTKQFNYKYEDSKLTLTTICPEVTEFPKDYMLFMDNFANSSAIVDKYKPSKNPNADYTDNKLPLEKQDGTPVNATWSKTGTGNTQEIKITAENETFTFKPLPPETEILSKVNK